MERVLCFGKISGSRFVKRKGSRAKMPYLASRVIDRTLRPLFDQSIRHAVQVIVTVISVDDNDSTILAVNAASLALSVSNIPWNGPIGCVRIRQVRLGRFKNKSFPQKLREDDAKYKFDLTVCGKNGNINMIEASAHQTEEEKELEAALN